MNQLIERLQPIRDLPVRWLAHAIDRTDRWTNEEKAEAMTYINTIRSADIGEEGEEIEIIPLPVPEHAPVTEPATPAPVKEPVPA